MPNGKLIHYAHVLDAAWILTLWKAIHEFAVSLIS